MTNRKKIFFTSDLHIGHQNVLEFSNRPFRNLDHMHSSFIKRFNSVLTDCSILYILGDVGLCRADIITNVISQIKGTKVLILGNHDKKPNAMYNIGFDVVLYSATLYIAGQRVTMSHCPLRGVYRENTEGMRGALKGENWHGESKESRKPFTLNNEGQFHLSGHIHSPNGGKSKRILGRQFDVGVDANKYVPVSISQIESWIALTLREEKNEENS